MLEIEYQKYINHIALSSPLNRSIDEKKTVLGYILMFRKYLICFTWQKRNAQKFALSTWHQKMKLLLTDDAVF